MLIQHYAPKTPGGKCPKGPESGESSQSQGVAEIWATPLAGTNLLKPGLTRNLPESVGPQREEGGSQPDRRISAERPQAYLT